MCSVASHRSTRLLITLSGRQALLSIKEVVDRYSSGARPDTAIVLLDCMCVCRRLSPHGWTQTPESNEYLSIPVGHQPATTGLEERGGDDNDGAGSCSSSSHLSGGAVGFRPVAARRTWSNNSLYSGSTTGRVSHNNQHALMSWASPRSRLHGVRAVAH